MLVGYALTGDPTAMATPFVGTFRWGLLRDSDPFVGTATQKPQPNYAGWPFGLLFWPLGAAFGLVAGWNLLQLVVYVLAGAVTCAWLRPIPK